MDADFSVELGPPREEATLELPWDSGVAQGPRYLDLKRQPDLLPSLEEAARYSELAEVLRVLNSRNSAFQTAKCDVWSSTELSEAEQIYDASLKFASYVDIVYDEQQVDARYSFFRHEDLARAIADLLKKAPDMAATVELIVRRCYYHQPAAEGGKSAEPRSGFYITVYVFGYGDDEDSSRQSWGIALQLVANAILQLSPAQRGTGRGK